ncbi:hypothetical protein L2E82_39429 [Cichorium intybus]|uniref:Uncharacterized protein n=1 Tax=Cichorium intybus TaxID=13427 RepID=A0ACB9AII3_CICIN|nr:hypothetical protein L2E82_39429 [Cichorium intybus]
MIADSDLKIGSLVQLQSLIEVLGFELGFQLAKTKTRDNKHVSEQVDHHSQNQLKLCLDFITSGLLG